MADTPNTEQLIKILEDAQVSSDKIAEIKEKLNKSISSHAKEATEDVSNFNAHLEDSYTVMQRVQNMAEDVGVSIEKLGDLTGPTALKFGLLGTAVVGAREKLADFAGLDTGTLGSFTEQTKDLLATITNKGTAPEVAIAAFGRLRNILGSLGVSSEKFNSLQAKGGKVLADYAKNIMLAADNSLKLQSALLQGTAQGGSFNDVIIGVKNTFEGIGPSLSKLNDLTSRFQNIMTTARIETGVTEEQMNQFAGSVFKMPDAVGAMVKGLNIAGTQFDTLTGIIRVAHGAGLNVAQTFEDISNAEVELNMNTQQAFDLVSRYVDVQKSLHARQVDVREAIMKTTNAFALWSSGGEDARKMTQSLTDSVNVWAQAFEKAGLAPKKALELATKYTTQLEGMNEAQEAFVSQTTGGPGGMLGAAQFEKLLATDPEEASRRMRESLQKMIHGPIVLMRDAQTEAQANQALYIRKILMSGVLGIKADSKAEADKMAIAIREGQAIVPATEKAKEQALKETMAIGEAKEDLTRTKLREANIAADSVRMQAGTVMLGGLENALSAGSGSIPITGRGMNISGIESLKNREAQGRGEPITPGTHIALRLVGAAMEDFLPTVVNATRSMKEQLTHAPTELPLPTTPQITGAAKAAPILPMAAPGPAATAPAAAATTINLDTEDVNFGTYVPAAGQVGQSAAASARAGTARAEPGATAAPRGAGPIAGQDGRPIPVVLVDGSMLGVNITGVCPDCGKPINQSQQAAVQSPSSMSTNRG